MLGAILQGIAAGGGRRYAASRYAVLGRYAAKELT